MSPENKPSSPECLLSSPEYKPSKMTYKSTCSLENLESVGSSERLKLIQTGVKYLQRQLWYTLPVFAIGDLSERILDR
jgi:hypothetical protein